MSSTRHAKPGAPPRQERFASSFHKGLLANLVARRAAELDRAAARASVWFAQKLSWQPEAFAKASIAIGASQEELSTVCLDPGTNQSPLFEALERYRNNWISNLGPITETAVSLKVFEALEYTRYARCLTIIDGPARTGKTFGARTFCEESAGLARYVQIPSSTDNISFYRAIAVALGVSSSLQLKEAELRQRIELTLHQGDLQLVLDEAHYAWPQNWQRYAMPDRVNWIMTALANFRVPVALVTTPQFYISQKRVEQLTGWASEQFIGRIGHIERLPAKLGKADLCAVAKALLPDAGAMAWEALASYADLSKKHLASIEAISQRAYWLAQKDGRDSAAAADVAMAMKGSVIPSDTALAESLAPAGNTRHGRAAIPSRDLRAFSAGRPRFVPP